MARRRHRRAEPLALYSTADRGRTWTSSSLPVPADVDVAAAADVEAVGTQLFVGIRLQPNRFGLSRGALLESEDGLTWKRLPLPAGGRLAFPTAKDGWLVGGLANEQLYATHNAGKTWRAVRPPAAITRARRPASTRSRSSSPRPTGCCPSASLRGCAPCSRSRRPTGAAPGRQPRRSRLEVARVRLGLAPAAVVDESYWLAAAGTRLVAVTDGGAARKTVGTLPAGPAAEFASAIAAGPGSPAAGSSSSLPRTAARPGRG